MHIHIQINPKNEYKKKPNCLGGTKKSQDKTEQESKLHQINENRFNLIEGLMWSNK